MRRIHARPFAYVLCGGGYERACMVLLSEPHRVYSRNVLLQVGQCVHEPPNYLRPALVSLRHLQRTPRRTRRGTKAGCRRPLRKVHTIVHNRLLKPASIHTCNGINYRYLRSINCCIGGGLCLAYISQQKFLYGNPTTKDKC